jgi:peptidoglycan/LPS O-acetylase OafA/YrhL
LVGIPYTIYLWHVLFNASARKVMIALGFYATPLLFTVGVAVGIGGPIALHHLASRTAWLSIPLLGIAKPRKPRARRANPLDVRSQIAR